MDSFFTSLTKGFFGQMATEESPGVGCLDFGMKVNDDRRPKRMWRSISGTLTPALVPADEAGCASDTRPVKRRRGDNGTSIDLIARLKEEEENYGSDDEKGISFTSLPEDLIANCLSFLGGVEDRYALQCTSKQFQRISNSDEMLIGIQVGGDKETGLNGIITEQDTPDTASDNLAPFAMAGNLEAIYMLGIIKSYCSRDVECGINLLKAASAQGYVRASYALGLVLRDSHPKEASDYMSSAASAGYIPALQEILPPRQMKAQYGEPKADELRRHLDPLCLNRLLTRHYVKSSDLRVLSTSHCWNPLCGRWAFKAVSLAPVRGLRQRRHAAHRRVAALRQHAAPHQRDLPEPPNIDEPQAQNVVLFDPSSLESNNNDAVPSGGDPRNSPINSALLGNAGVMAARIPQSLDIRVSRMKMCSRCCRAKYCSKLCQVYDWRSGRHKTECPFL